MFTKLGCGVAPNFKTKSLSNLTREFPPRPTDKKEAGEDKLLWFLAELHHRAVCSDHRFLSCAV